MYKKYSQYTSSDFLVDEYFIDSMNKPTRESELFWKKMILEEKINVDEFISAYNLFKEIQNNKPEVDDAGIDTLWNRINTTNSQRSRRILWRKISVAAAVLAVLVTVGSQFINISNVNGDELPGLDLADGNLIHLQDEDSEIVVLSGGKMLSMSGNLAELEYDENGNLKLNNQVVESNNATPNQVEDMAYNQLKVPFGKQAFLKLSDGTSLWVNTGTTVTYPVSFSEKQREIFVDGEVYAEVAHEPNRPFVIKTDQLNIRVLGTSFNLTAYKEDKSNSVVLVTGSVDVTPFKGKSTLMKPNQMYAINEGKSTLQTVNTESFTSWHKGLYIFENEPVENVLLRLSRYYNVTMKLPPNKSGISCSGKLEMKDDVNQVLSLLSYVSKIQFEKKDGIYLVRYGTPD